MLVNMKKILKQRADLVPTGVSLLVSGEGDDGVGENAKLNGSNEA
jgi:hypothetical protein